MEGGLEWGLKAEGDVVCDRNCGVGGGRGEVIAGKGEGGKWGVGGKEGRKEGRKGYL